MDYKLFKVRLDLTKENRLPIKPVQGESAVKIEFTLAHNAQPFPLTGTTVNVKFRKKDGTISLLPGVITNATAGIAEVKLTNQVLLFSGAVVGIVEVLGDAGVAKSFIFTMEVQPGVDDPNTESVDEYPAIDQAFLDIQSIRNDFDAIVAGLTEDSEVILARGGYELLGERLDESDKNIRDLDTNKNYKVALEIYQGEPRLKIEEVI